VGNSSVTAKPKTRLENILKYLLLLALIALLFWLLYRRLRPYIQILRKVIGILAGAFDKNSTSQSQWRRVAPDAENRLVRCAACDTWIPQRRALNADSASYCSRECLQKAPATKRRKAAS
jgi:hypothetical protein